MSEEQKRAHERMLATLPVRTIADDPDHWAESDRPLSAEEIPYLLAGCA
jgi:hypothetical protein